MPLDLLDCRLPPTTVKKNEWYTLCWDLFGDQRSARVMNNLYFSLMIARVLKHNISHKNRNKSTYTNSHWKFSLKASVLSFLCSWYFCEKQDRTQRLQQLPVLWTSVCTVQWRSRFSTLQLPSSRVILPWCTVQASVLLDTVGGYHWCVLIYCFSIVIAMFSLAPRPSVPFFTAGNIFGMQ